MANIHLIMCAPAGFLIGALSGHAPGLHVNNFAARIMDLSSAPISEGLTTFQAAAMILAARIPQTFFDTTPAIFIGAPHSGTILAPLPDQAMMRGEMAWKQ